MTLSWVGEGRELPAVYDKIVSFSKQHVSEDSLLLLRSDHTLVPQHDQVLHYRFPGVISQPSRSTTASNLAIFYQQIPELAWECLGFLRVTLCDLSNKSQQFPEVLSVRRAGITG